MKTKIILMIALLSLSQLVSVASARTDKKWSCLFQGTDPVYRKATWTYIYAKHPIGGWGLGDADADFCCCNSVGSDAYFHAQRTSYPSYNYLGLSHAFISNTKNDHWVWANSVNVSAAKRNSVSDYAYINMSVEDSWVGDNLNIKISGKMGMSNAFTGYNLRHRIVVWQHSSAEDITIDENEVLWESQIEVHPQLVNVTGDLTSLEDFGYTAEISNNDSTTLIPDTLILDIGEFDSTEVTLTIIADLIPDNWADDAFDWSSEESFTTSISNILDNNDKTVLYPNPANCYEPIHIKTASPKKAKIRITDLVGRLVYDTFMDMESNVQYDLPLGLLTKGIYIINVTDSESNLLFSDKVVIK